ncbi:MAG: peptidylprolyl isomerase, partial [Verrucomicrobiales bacterium]|nr:peptidylprolyl isomerase [Verrucomicrobiales bacterium]
MKPKIIAIFYIFLSTLSYSENPKVLLETNHGDITIELNEEKAPITVKNFISYVEKKFYDNTIFHRIIDGFMIQGGGFSNEEMPAQKKPNDPI